MTSTLPLTERPQAKPCLSQRLAPSETPCTAWLEAAPTVFQQAFEGLPAWLIACPVIPEMVTSRLSCVQLKVRVTVSGLRPAAGDFAGLSPSVIVGIAGLESSQ